MRAKANTQSVGQVLLAPVLIGLFFVCTEVHGQNCSLKIETDPFTKERVIRAKPETLVSIFGRASSYISLQKKGDSFSFGLSLIDAAIVQKLVQTESDTLFFLLANGEVIKSLPRTPATGANTQAGYAYSFTFNLSPTNFNSLAESPITKCRLSFSGRYADYEIKEKHGTNIRSAVKCILKE